MLIGSVYGDGYISLKYDRKKKVFLVRNTACLFVKVSADLGSRSLGHRK